MHTYKFLDRRFGGRFRANIVNMAEIQPKVHLHTSFTHVTLKPWRWRMQNWTLSCRSVLLLTPGVGMVIQQLIEKPSLSQQILWQFSNKQAENTHPCTPTSRTKIAVKLFLFFFFSYLHVIFIFMSAQKIDIILVLFSDRVTEHLCCVIYINT